MKHNLTKQISSLTFYWHIHHDELVEPIIEPIENRIEFIKNYKSPREILIRLHLLKPVMGKLPKAVIEAGNAYKKAGIAFDKAHNAFNKACGPYQKVWRDCHKAWSAYLKIKSAYDKVIMAHLPKIEALHKKECPNCPWNGKTIFPKEG